MATQPINKAAFSIIQSSKIAKTPRISYHCSPRLAIRTAGCKSDIINHTGAIVYIDGSITIKVFRTESFPDPYVGLPFRQLRRTSLFQCKLLQSS